MKIITVMLTSVLLIALAAFVVMLERWAAISLQWWFIVIAIGLGIIFALPGVIHNKICALLLLIYLLFVVSLPFFSLSPVKPYRQFFASISTESNQNDVIEKVREHFSESGRYRQPTWKEREDGSLIFWLDPSDGRYNAEIITVSFSNGVVNRKQYVMD